MNAESQSKTRRDRKTLSEQCKEVEKNNRMEKIRDLFQKIGHTKATFHAKMGTINDTYLEPDILEFKVKWALGSIIMNKTSGDDGIPVELFQIQFQIRIQIQIMF